MADPPFRLSPGLEPEDLAAEFRSKGRVRIPEFLVREDAERLLRSLRESQDWMLITNHGEKLFRLKRSDYAALGPAQREQIAGAVHDGARHGFQYLFETIEVPDGATEREAIGSELSRFAEFLSAGTARDFLREVTGEEEISFADAQATAYGPGHFLTGHDDQVAGKKRRAAYVMNLIRSWRIEWGGLLAFHGGDGHVEEAWLPTFNALSLFAVPLPHSVSYVTPFAGNRRYSVTGWLRSGAPPP